MTIILDRKEQQELLTIVQHSIDYFERMTEVSKNPHEGSRRRMRARLATAREIQQKLKSEETVCDPV